MDGHIESRVSTGIAGLDEILGGGLTSNRLYLVEGSPGSGKTTLALQFLLAGAAQAETGLYVTLSETTEELRAVGVSHGWDLGGVELFDLSAAEEVLGENREQTLLHPWEVELGATLKLIVDRVEAVKPARVVFDSLSEMRLLAQDPLRYRRQVLALKQFFAGRRITMLLLDDLTGGINERDQHLHSLCHGVVTLERQTADFGTARRRLQVQKLRGVKFIGGFHDFVIRTGGIDVFTRLIAADHHRPFAGDPVASGIESLDAIFRGGPRRGTCTLISGPAGTGKTTLATHYLWAACQRGEACALYEFDERIGTLLMRARILGLDLQSFIDSGLLRIRQIDPAEISPGEFAGIVRREVEQHGVRMILVDSLSGYLAAMPQEQQLILQLHELLAYLNQQGVITFLINPQQGFVGAIQSSGLTTSYVADAVVLLRYFEAGGRVRKAISVLKNRGGAHEDSVREFRIDNQGIRIGAPLAEFRGVLNGTPDYAGARELLMEDRGDAG